MHVAVESLPHLILRVIPWRRQYCPHYTGKEVEAPRDEVLGPKYALSSALCDVGEWNHWWPDLWPEPEWLSWPWKSHFTFLNLHFLFPRGSHIYLDGSLGRLMAECTWKSASRQQRVTRIRGMVVHSLVEQTLGPSPFRGQNVMAQIYKCSPAFTVWRRHDSKLHWR